MCGINDLPYTVFDTGTLDGFKGSLSPSLLFSFSVAPVLPRLRKQFIKKMFSQLGPVLLVLIISDILRKSWRVFHDRSLLGRCFRGFVLPVLEYCSVVWCSAADTLTLLHRAVSGARFLTGGVFECDFSHRRSVALLCMLNKKDQV